MKVPFYASLLLALGLLPLSAIERPKSLDEDKTKEGVSTEQPKDQLKEGDAEADQGNEPEAIPQVDRPAGAWLGVLSKSVGETLRIHLGVEEGVVLDYVAPGSPAAKAGLGQHDIILEVNGESIGSQDELREAIQAHKPGDKVTLAVLSKGEEGEREVEMAERPREPGNPPPGVIPGRERARGLLFRDLPELPKDLENLIPPGGGEDLQRQLEGQMKKFEKQLREMERGGGPGLKLDFDLFKDLQRGNKEGGAFNFNFKSSSSFKFVDEKGSVEMKTTDGGKEVIVRDAEGKMLFEGPWDTEQDKAAAPEDIRERIEGMNQGNRFHFRLDQLPEPELEIPEEEKPELE